MKTTKKAFILGAGYTHFAVNKETNLIITGWDYSDVESDDLRQFKKDYFDMDLNDLEIDPKTTKILNRKSVEKLHSEISNSNNWQK
jgi:hypothetical protein